MSKLVIHTQYCENYGDAESPRWKFKGGETYVLPELSQSELNGIEEIVNSIADEIEHRGEMTEEYVIGWSVEEDEAEVCEEWETPWTLTAGYNAGRWMIERTIPSEPWWSGNYAGKYERRPARMGSLYDPDLVVVKYIEKEAV